LFAGRHFDREVIILCVRWYLRYKLSFRDLVEMMAERGLPIAHTTILRWVRRYAPEFIKRWNRFSRSNGRSWRVDETYIKVRGVWVYLYRAVDKAGRTVDFRLSKKRDVGAAKAFFRKAILHEGRPPNTITLDGYAASHRAVHEMRNDGLLPRRTSLRSSKYLNNLVEQDHRGIKSRTPLCSGSRTSPLLPRPLLEWNCFGVFTRINSPSAASASKTRLRLHSGMRYWLLDLKHRRQLNTDH
jgi:transposase-like protein